jgi:hypothetical protein
MQDDAATTLLQQAGLGSRTEQKPGDDAAGKVIGTTPQPATPVKKGETVTLMVSTGPKAENPGGPSGPASGGTGAAGGPAAGGPAAGGTGAAGGPAAGGPAAGGPGPTPPKQIEIPALTGNSVDAATKALTDLGLKVKVAPDPVHSNAVGDGKVLSSEPKAATTADPGSDVTLTVAKNTARVNLIDIADNTEKATWTASAPAGTEKLTVGSKPGTTGGLVNKRAGSLDSGRGTLDPSTVTTVLETRPPDSGLVTGEYKLEPSVIPGDHVKALVGVVKTPETTDSATGKTGGANTGDEENKDNQATTTDGTKNNEITFSVVANDQPIKTVTLKPDMRPQQLDADLSQVKDATSVKIIVTSSGKQDPKVTPVWQGLRLEPTVGK